MVVYITSLYQLFTGMFEVYHFGIFNHLYVYPHLHALNTRSFWQLSKGCIQSEKFYVLRKFLTSIQFETGHQYFIYATQI